MTTHPDLPPDAPLRHRLWFRFWRRWPKAMLGLVMLAAAAWGTRPGLEVHVTAFRAYALVEGLLGEQRDYTQIEDPASRAFAEAADHRRQMRFISEFMDDVFEPAILWGTSSIGGVLPGVSAFGYVWVLD